jgi:hypothetical protein
MNNEVVAFMHSGDHRWGFPKMEVLKSAHSRNSRSGSPPP